MQLQEKFELPLLRQDLRLLKGTPDEDGSPRWLIYDPIDSKYYTISRQAFDLLRHWEPGCSSDTYLLKTQTTGLTFEELKAFTDFLLHNSLTISNNSTATRRFLLQQQKSSHGWFRWLIHNYLFFRIPLLRPDVFLNWLFPKVKFLFHPNLAFLFGLIGLIGIFLATRQWDHFSTTFLHFVSWQGFLFYGLTLAVVKIMHEFGHALVAKRYGCRVSSMGIAFIVLSPILYTDTTDAWKLKSRFQRLAITTAGIRVELYLASLALFLWGFLPDSPIRNMAFFVATTSCITSLMINLSPFMRFDGYYAFADWIGAENLQQRSFALGRWYMRNTLFGFDDPTPEPMSKKRQTLFISYAWFTWICRFFLFMGIAFLVYYFAFKVLGIVLFLIEIIGFIALPIYRELSHWWKMKSKLSWNKNVVTTFSLLALMMALLFIPWQTSVSLPAILKVQNYSKLYSPEDAVIQTVNIKVGDSVVAGSALLILSSPELEFEIRKSKINQQLLEAKLARIAGSDEERDSNIILRQSLAREKQIAQGLEDRQALLTIRAPFNGEISDIRPLVVGQSVNHQDSLISIVGHDNPEVIAFLPSKEIGTIKYGANGVFIKNDGSKINSLFKITSISPIAMDVLPYSELSSEYQGPIAAHKGKEDKLIPDQAYYQITLKPETNIPSESERILGYTVINGQPISTLSRIWQNTAAVIIRESGF